MSCCKESEQSKRVCKTCGLPAQTSFPSDTGEPRPICISCAEKLINATKIYTRK